MASWQLQEAKARLSEVIATAKEHGPQIITQRGVNTAVIVPFDQWERKNRPQKRTLLEILQSGPKGDLPIPPRGQFSHRKPVKF